MTISEQIKKTPLVGAAQTSEPARPMYGIETSQQGYGLKKSCLPDAMQRCTKWLTWKVDTDENGKQRKRPLTANGKWTSYGNPAIWTDLDHAIDLTRGGREIHLGLSLTTQGLNLGEGYLWCLDFDGWKCGLDLDSGAQHFVERMDSYAETSPSGTGFKIFFTSDAPPARNSKVQFSPSKFAQSNPGVMKYAGRAVEVFSQGRFLAVTGSPLLEGMGRELRHIPSTELDRLLSQLHSWAVQEGGRGIDRGEQKPLESGSRRATSLKYRRLLESSLTNAVLPRIDHHNEQNWTDVSNALARAYGEAGRGYFLRWSQDGYGQGCYANFDQAECDARFDRALREGAGKDGYGCNHLIRLANLDGIKSLGLCWEGDVNPQLPLFHDGQLPPARFTFRTPRELAQLPPLSWRVKKVLPDVGLAAIYGQSGSGKSFLVLDLLARISLGMDFYGCKTVPCPVVYVCLEASGGISNRIKAWEQHHQRTLPDTFRVVTDQLSLFDQDAKPFAEAVKGAGLNAGAIVVDTLNQSAPTADENTSADMGRIIQNAMTMQRLTGSLVILVHHSGKEASRGLRGHSSLLAALDAAIEVRRPTTGREWGLSKAKDADDSISHPFRLEHVGLGFDPDGEPINSCVAIPDSTRIFQRPPPKGKNQVAALAAIKAHVASSGISAMDHGAAMECVKAAMGGERKRQATRAKEAIDGLITGGHVTQSGDTISIC